MKMLMRMFAVLLGLGVVSLATLPEALAQGKKMVAATGHGTIKGTVTLDGEAPKPKQLNFAGHKDEAHCKKGDTEDHTWVVGPDKGVANVVVFLKPPAGQSFAVDMSKKTWPDEVVIDQPYCAFMPHVSVMFSEYQGKPVQKLLVKNSAPILHNSRVAGSPLKNPAKGETLAAGAHKEFTLKPDTQVIKINCDAHKWMEAFIWSFDHPYAAVTDDKGHFEIKNAPLGAEVSVMYWHEAAAPNAGKEFKKTVLKDGDTFDIKLKK